MLSKYQTEQVGISAEVAIARLADVPVSDSYHQRARPEIVDSLMPAMAAKLPLIPPPTQHIAEDQNPVDFLLADGRTLSVKTNMKNAGKVAPQNIGQPTSQTFWSRLPHFVPDGIDVKRISYEESAKLFKRVAQTRITDLLTEYWKNLFDCDFMLYAYNILSANNELSQSPVVKIFDRVESPVWRAEELSFSQDLVTWNESCTVKYTGISIGEFQIHNNRNCFKFRFNLDGLVKSGVL